jgi:hypothetical protein
MDRMFVAEPAREFTAFLRDECVSRDGKVDGSFADSIE